MTEVRYAVIKELMETQGIELTPVRQGGNFVFPFYVYEDFKDLPIEVLDLSERAKNALKRCGIITLYDVSQRISGREDLMKLRNCGTRSVAEILEKLFLYQVMRKRPEEREAYLMECVKRSMGGQRN